MSASSDRKSSGDSFSTFLQTMKKGGKAASASQVQRPIPPAAVVERPRTGAGEHASPLDLLKHIEPGTAMPVHDLMSASGMSLYDFTEALKAVESAGLVELESTDGPDRCRLTPIGAKLVTGE